MDLSNILSEIDKQIAQLQQARALLSDSRAPKKVGRPPNIGIATVVASDRKPFSADAKAKISAAQKKRWAKAKRAAVVKKVVTVVAKKAPAKKAASHAKSVPVKTALNR